MEAVNNAIFSINKLDHADSRIIALLAINKESQVFAGHFPGQPVVPGACMLQIIKEVLESALNTSLLLKKADSLKFIGMIFPDAENARLELSYKLTEDESIKVTGKLSSGDVVCFKMQGSFTSCHSERSEESSAP